MLARPNLGAACPLYVYVHVARRKLGNTGTPPEEWKGKEEGDAGGTGSMAPKAETLTRQRKLHADTVSVPADAHDGRTVLRDINTDT